MFVWVLFINPEISAASWKTNRRIELNSSWMMLPPHSWSWKLLLCLILAWRLRGGWPIADSPFLRLLAFYRLHHFPENNKSMCCDADQVESLQLQLPPGHLKQTPCNRSTVYECIKTEIIFQHKLQSHKVYSYKCSQYFWECFHVGSFSCL